ncbi:alpha/beta hydrolase [Candidatus Roizmanbacteria bacterium]|nr:alpha/beta hydrolase [Candidatus Roizmanbacteria bacterium]
MFLTVDGVTIHYEKRGKGRPIFLVHGWGGSSKSLEKLGSLLATHFTVILPDLPGFGQSDTPPQNWGVDEYAQMLTKLSERLGFKTINYFGHSFGGSLGICIASQPDTPINRLILCNSSYQRKTSRNILTKIFFWIPRPIKRILYRIFFRHSDMYRYPELEPNFRLIMKHDLTPRLANIHAETMIVWSQNDQTTYINLAHKLNHEIKKSILRIVPNTIHNLPIREPELVYKEIIKWYGIS